MLYAKLLLAETTVYCSETAYASLSQFFFLNITKHRHAFLALWLVERCSLLCVVDCSCVPVDTRCFGRLPGAVTSVLGVLEGWNFSCIVTPPWGADHIHFKKIDEKKIFLVLLVPLTLRLITPVLRVIGVWNLSCVLTPLMRDRLPHFCFKIRWGHPEIFYPTGYQCFSKFLQRKNIPKVINSKKFERVEIKTSLWGGYSGES